MNLQNYYYFFQNALTPRFCDELIKYGISQQEQLALTGGQTTKINEGKPLDDKDIVDLKKKRDSNIVWMSEPWIYRELHGFVHQANRLAGWNFEWSFSEACQFTKYGPGQHYGAHCDSWESPYANKDNPDTFGKIRKLSVTCSLSSPEDYEGGELEFDFRNMDPDKQSVRKCAEIKPRGSIVVFPSHVWHRVKPVTKGTRYSLVIWNLGYPFK
jgi:PKHD-type hydroxylase